MRLAALRASSPVSASPPTSMRKTGKTVFRLLPPFGAVGCASACHSVGVACMTVAPVAPIARASAGGILHGLLGVMATQAPLISGR